MRALEQQGVFTRSMRLDFQGTCNSGPRFNKVTTNGLADALPTQGKDAFRQFVGPIQKQSMTFGCVAVVWRQQRRVSAPFSLITRPCCSW